MKAQRFDIVIKGESLSATALSTAVNAAIKDAFSKVEASVDTEGEAFGVGTNYGCAEPGEAKCKLTIKKIII